MPAEATQDADALLRVHWLRIDDVLKQAGDLSGCQAKVMVTCSLPIAGAM
jgi:hypothetical protein